jgi:antigen flippase
MRGATPFGADTALTLGANLVLGVEGAVSGIMAARLLGPKGRGEFAAIQSFAGFVATIAMLGMIEAVVYYCARNSQRAGSYISSCMTIALLASVPILAGAYFLMPRALAAQSPEVIRAARWYLLMAPVYALVAVPAHSLRGCGDFVAWNGIRLVPNFLWILVLAVASCAAFRKTPALAEAYVAAQATVGLPVFWIVAKRMQGPFRPSTKEWGGIISYGFPCTLTSLPHMLNLRLDQIAMAVALQPRQLGTYAVAVAWSGITAPILTALGATLLPSVASHRDSAAGADQFSRGVRIACLLSLGSCIALTALTPFGLTVFFGEGYRASIPAALVLVPAGSILALNTVLQEGLRGLGYPYPVLLAELAGLVATAAGLALTLGPLGIMGGALSSLGGYATVCAALLISSQWLIGVSPVRLLWPRNDELKAGIEQLKGLARSLAAVSD